MSSVFIQLNLLELCYEVLCSKIHAKLYTHSNWKPSQQKVYGATVASSLNNMESFAIDKLKSISQLQVGILIWLNGLENEVMEH